MCATSRRGVAWETKVNQKISQWPHGQFARYLTEKAARQGISVEWIDEAYSTRTCCVCSHVHSTAPRGRQYACSGCGARGHRDVNGSEQHLLEGGAGPLWAGPGGHRHVSPSHRSSAFDTGQCSYAHARTSRLQPGECQYQASRSASRGSPRRRAPSARRASSRAPRLLPRQNRRHTPPPCA